MTEPDEAGRNQGDPAELNRGIGQEIVGEPSPGPQQRPLDRAAGGPGSGAGESGSADRAGNQPRTEEERRHLPRNS